MVTVLKAGGSRTLGDHRRVWGLEIVRRRSGGVVTIVPVGARPVSFQVLSLRGSGAHQIRNVRGADALAIATRNWTP